jgi:hypothetical protein
MVCLGGDMSKYRILEKEGTQNSHYQPNSHICNGKCGLYIPRFIVQGYGVPEGFGYTWTDLKEFTSLEEAREYKRSLELAGGGIV